MAKLAEELMALGSMSPPQLRAEWRRVQRTLPPDVPTDILRRAIAWRLQERVHGGLPAATIRELDRVAARLAKSEAAVASTVRLKPGTRLVRRWQGKTYTVVVADDGFVLDDRRYASLSQIAEAITGAHWSGPRFFGTGRVKTAAKPLPPPSLGQQIMTVEETAHA
jgi:hypothetical protein